MNEIKSLSEKGADPLEAKSLSLVLRGLAGEGQTPFRIGSNKRGPSTRKSFWLRWPFLVTAIPLGLALVGAVAIAVGEYRAAGRVEAEWARVRAAGQPTDNQSLAVWFRDRTSAEGTMAWTEILRLAASSALTHDRFDDLPFIGNAPIEPEIPAAGTWAQERAVADFLADAGPLIVSIKELDRYPRPIWVPIEFRGFDTLLPEVQASRSISRLLQVEIEHALYVGDSQRAMDALAAMKITAEAGDQELCLVSELVDIALRGVHHMMIQRSMGRDIWTEDDLMALLDQTPPSGEIGERWRRVIGGERAMIVSHALYGRDAQWMLGSDGHPAAIFLTWPSTREAILSVYREYETIGDGGIEGLVPRAKRFEEKLITLQRGGPTFFSLVPRLMGMLLPATRAFADAVQRDEDTRRLTRTAVGVKLYQIRNGRWPERLSQLKDVGLTAADWNTVSAGPMGYEVEGDQAFVWGFDPWNMRQPSQVVSQTVSPTRPEPKETGGTTEYPWVTIR